MSIWSEDYRLAAFVPYYDFWDYFCVWKPHNIATTFGVRYSFLDYLCDAIGSFDSWLSLLLSTSLTFFGRDRELWLLNRLDYGTAWLLYFAKTAEFFSHYRDKHRCWLIYKYYSADVLGRWDGDCRFVCYPLYHHKYQHDRMIAFMGSDNERRVRGRRHEVETYCSLLKQNDWWASLLIIIRHGVRHQIRTHLSSIGYPILWDSLYGTSVSDYLHLWSLWCEIY